MTERKVILLEPKTTNQAVQGIPQYFGVSRHSVGAEGLSMNLTVFPPGGQAKVHRHRGYETAIYSIAGYVALYYGPELEELCIIKPGDFCFIPAEIPHVAYNLHDDMAATSVSSRNDPVEQENVILMPELEGLRDAEIAELRKQYAGKA